MDAYQTYKDSGVEWIGEIPSHWSILRNKYFTTQRKDKSETGEEDLLSVSEHHGVVPRRVIRDGEEHLSRSDSFEGYLKVSPGELVSNIMLMWKTGLGVSEYEGLVSPAYSVFRFTHGSPKYFHYLFRTSQYTSEYRRNSTGVIESRLRLYDDSFGRLPSHSPPLHEQERIVAFLDSKTALIDSLIEKTVRKIELLKEKRTSLINEVVTKGLNPDVEMKDSEVEWIGQIPSHWERNKLNRISERIGDGLHSTPLYVDSSEYYFINGNNLVDGVIEIFDSTKCVSEEEYKKHFIQLNNKTLLLSINGTIGNLSFYNDEKVILGKSSCYINLNEDINHHFIYYVLKSESISKYFTFELTGTTIYNLSLNSIRNTPIVIPPLNEQQQIVEYLDEQTQLLGNTISTEERRIELLKEYRQSLISEVVTGKVKVTTDEQEIHRTQV